jgi:hypothetical protein
MRSFDWIILWVLFGEFKGGETGWLWMGAIGLALYHEIKDDRWRDRIEKTLSGRLKY